MISFIKGKIEHITDNYIIIDNNGIGYNIFVSVTTISKLNLNQEIKIYTYMNVREDSLSLYGFLTMEELSVFNLLLNVSGVGPKVAIAMINQLSPNEIMLAIVTEDYDTLSKCPGVGKKTSQRITLELKDKIKAKENFSATSQQTISPDSGQKQDSIDALTALGYSRNESMKVVMEVALPNMTTEQIIKLSLRKISSQM